MFRRSTLCALFVLVLVSGSAAPTPVDAQGTQLPDVSGAWPRLDLPTVEVVDVETQIDLGSWSKVDGLKVTFDVVDYRPGGGTVVLHRPAGRESHQIAEWLARLAETFEPTSLTITQLGPAGVPIARWRLSGVFPIKWQLSALDGGSDVAIETLVVAYERVDRD